MADDYALLDFGDGGKLERFGQFILDRPCPAAEGVRRADPDAWRRATARFELTGEQRGGQRGRWLPDGVLPASWAIAIDALRFEIKPTDFGHVGLFPEQITNWRWIAERVQSQIAPQAAGGARPRILNLFAYTGGSTLAAAAVGAEVVHVDSSRAAVAWARRNAELSGLSAAPIRWIVEDAARFVRRELARCRQYDGIILDPPSYGHGPAGEVWKLEADLPPLLVDCARLCAARHRWLLLTCHTPQITELTGRELVAAGIENTAAGASEAISVRELTLASANGRPLGCGIVAFVGDN
jgi:23S rRNA (cytosine1962-C5)-methyltransferase